MEHRTIMLQEVRKMRFQDTYGGYKSGDLTSEEAAYMLCCSERTFRRMRVRYEEEGVSGLVDRRIGHIPPNKIAADEVQRMLTLYQEKYWDFNIQHFYEQLKKKHDFTNSYNFVRLSLRDHGCIIPRQRKSKHRLKRPRKSLPGMMLHQDGSKHEWLIGLGHYLDLIITMDDATSEIYSAFLVEEEGTNSTFKGIKEVIEGHGLFSSFYTDRGSHYALTPSAGGKVDKSKPTQVMRALGQLGIQHIHAYSPEARGRSERMFGSWQKRLPQELRAENITTISAANKYIKEIFIPEYNESFSIAAEGNGSAFIPFVGGNLDDVLCIHEERVVNNDNSVSYHKIILQIPADDCRHHYVKCKVRVHEYSNGDLAIFHGPRKIGSYDNKGNILKTKEKKNVMNELKIAA
jgi:transposase